MPGTAFSAVVDAGGVLDARHREIGLAASVAAGHSRDFLHQLARRKARAPAPPCRQPQPTLVLPSASPITAVTDAGALSRALSHSLRSASVAVPVRYIVKIFYAVHVLGILKQTAGLHGRLPLLKVVQFLLHGSQFCGERSRAGGQVVDIAYLQRARRLVEHIGFFIQQAQHAVACCAFDAPDPRRHAGFGQNLEAAQFGRIGNVAYRRRIP